MAAKTYITDADGFGTTVIVKCNCGAKVECSIGEDTECRCGQPYNGAGQALRVSRWSEYELAMGMDN